MNFSLEVKNNRRKGEFYMANRFRFRPGDKAPNNGIYIETGETGSSVVNPKQVKLKAGDHFPETSNHNRQWRFKG